VIVLVTGPPGSGKSFFAVRQLGEALNTGKSVATNVQLSPHTPELVARANKVRYLRPGRVAQTQARVARATYVAHDVHELFRVRLRGEGEGRGVMVLDEAHVWLNSRAWSADDRHAIVTFFTQHRKLGWDVYLIVQDAEMIDKQVRVLVEYQVHLRNLRRARLFGLIPFSPVNLFLAIWTWHGMRGKPVKRKPYLLNWARKLYDTKQIHGQAGDDDAGVVWLPMEAPAAAAGAGASATVPGAAGAASEQPHVTGAPSPYVDVVSSANDAEAVPSDVPGRRAIGPAVLALVGEQRAEEGTGSRAVSPHVAHLPAAPNGRQGQAERP
jgi:zona occludens toxin